MNNLNMSRVFYILTLFILLAVSCSSEKNPTKQVASNQDLSSHDIEAITIKGFSLGMDFSKAQEQAIKLFEELGFSKEIATKINPDNTRVFLRLVPIETDHPPISIWVCKDKEDKLVTLIMDPLAVNNLFNAEQLSAKEFVKEFTINYSLPELIWTIPEKGPITYWKYESKNGWFIQINDKKTLIFGKIPEKIKPDIK